MGKYKTVFGVYWVNDERTKGGSTFWDTLAQASHKADLMARVADVYILEQTYELEEDSHDCGDDE